jgi:transposase-like protein
MDAKLTAQAEQLARVLATQASTMDELNGLFKGLLKTALQSMLNTEMDFHLGRKDLPVPLDPPSVSHDVSDTKKNRKNGYSKKTVQGELGEIPLDIPRDRNGPFEPQLIGKYQRRLCGFDDKILALYAKGLPHATSRMSFRTFTEWKSPLLSLPRSPQTSMARSAEAEKALERFAQKWDRQYPTISKPWRLRWTQIVAMFEFPPEIRKAIYTTKAIESVNSAIRKYTRNRKLHPSADSAVKLTYLAINEASKKWTMPIVGWKQALNHFAILFEGRLPLNLNK